MCGETRPRSERYAVDAIDTQYRDHGIDRVQALRVLMIVVAGVIGDRVGIGARIAEMRDV